MKTISRALGVLMLLAAVLFIAFALHHPEAGFPWSNTVTYLLYGAYLAVMIVLFAAPFPKK